MDVLKIFFIWILIENVFNHFELNDGKSTMPQGDIDPDLHYFNDLTAGNNLSDSDYYVTDDFIKKCKSLSDNDSCFSEIYMNIRSLPRHLHEFEAYLHYLEFDFTVIVLSEIWFTDSTAERYGLTETENNTKIYLAGDYIINLLSIDRHVPTSEFLELMFPIFSTLW